MRVAQNLFANYRVLDNTAYVVMKEDAYILDEVGQLVWKEIGEGNTVENIVNTVIHTYQDRGGKIKNIEKDINSFIKDLLKNNLIEEVI
ncbi:hypothetical protein CN395_27915 [Priestia megaterium]|uniref:PqqD family protein n=1 Tax=Priestia megaterium TaxID=1404 RepID=UPI000BF5712F|nr:PqqD family protein [Priestia megaterium]PEU52186.1 hypothetical protein CN395_27915 [Priestia megaterium]